MRNVLTALVAGLLACAAQAQVVEIDRVDPQALACLQKDGPAIRYPARDEQMRNSGHVRVSLKFTAPDRAPEVMVLFRAASEAMVDEVNWFVRGYRLPCMPAGGASVLAVQEFEFKPRVTDSITWTAPRAVAAREETSQGRPRALSCMRTPKEPPEYGGSTLQREVANAFVELSFTAPDAPPEVRMAYASVGERQAKLVTDYVRQYRLPCLAAGAKPYVVQQHFQFRPYGVSARVFKDAVSLTSFLSNMKGVQSLRADFDLNTMACPFQVAWTLGKPALDNRVGEVGKPDLNRTEFLTWLAGLEMEVKATQFEQLVGQTVIVNVPCGRLALVPKAE